MTGMIMDQFVALLRSEMERKEMSIAELARVAKCGRPYIHRVLAGEHAPSLAWVEKVCPILGIRVRFESDQK